MMNILTFKKIAGIGLLLGSGLIPVFATNTIDVSLKGTLIVNPPCELTSVGGGMINVDFGDVVIRKMSAVLSGRAYKQPLPYRLVCDAPEEQGIYIYLKAEPATFNNRLVWTTNENVGLLFLNNNGIFTPIGNPAGMKVGQQTVMEVVPIRNDAENVTVTAGDFSATATLTAIYQ